MSNPQSEQTFRLSMVAEVTRNSTPSTPSLIEVPHLSGSFFQNERKYERSGLIRSNRMGGGQVGGTRESMGVVKTPMMNDPAVIALLESALGGAFGSAVASGSITGTFAASGKTFTRASGSFLTDAVGSMLRIGDVVQLSGASNNATTLSANITSSATSIPLTSAANCSANGGVIVIANEWIVYTGKSTNTLTGCVRGSFGTTATSASSGAAVNFCVTITNLTSTVLTFSETISDESSVSINFKTKKYQLIAGTTRKFFTFEEYSADIGVFELFSGQEVNTLQGTVPTSGECTLDFNLVGLGYANAQVSGSTYVAASTNKSMSGSVEGCQLLIDRVAPAGCVTNLQFNVANNRVMKYGVGQQYPCHVAEGDFEATLAFALYRTDLSVQTLFGDGTLFELINEVRDQERNDGFRYIWPKTRFTNGPKGVDNPTIVDQMQAYAEYDSVTGTKMIIERIIGS